ncbi:inositol polyphosphate 1-phosphatase-like [Gigantopelta aegis]|uniref:inositol polyphosphate 1-phosphatase-like n=1 Tax=Gigantopelta aegis TaxID=1735272 RepID=UPI001B88B5F6|nr:inositol polyphosphate 1-phosphatase-like [Gigantopelta aegis]
MIPLSELLSALIGVAQKGAHVASIIRSDADLLELLVQEKSSKEKNPRFVHDFKTLADVIIQEMVRHDLSKEFAGIESRIHGEESSIFTNTLGETVVVQLKNSVEETKTLLCDVLNGNSVAAGLLAEAVHSSISASMKSTFRHVTGEIPISDVCVWIDPIDSTAQYIQGQVGCPNEFGIVNEGLQCVTILIGAYNRITGLPVMGVVVQPFAHFDELSKRWKTEINWGVCHNNRFSSFDDQTIPKRIPTVIVSSSESEDVRHKLSKDFCLQYAAGAGYKLLCVARGLVDAYVLSRASIFSWDCCALHAVLLALGGGLVAFSDVLSQDVCQVKYNHVTSTKHGHSIAGVVAYRSENNRQAIVTCLKS